MGYKRNIKESVRRLLYANSGNACAMYGCNNALIYANTVRRHFVGGANRTLISVETPPRSCRIGTCRRLSAG